MARRRIQDQRAEPTFGNTKPAAEKHALDYGHAQEPAQDSMDEFVPQPVLDIDESVAGPRKRRANQRKGRKSGLGWLTLLIVLAFLASGGYYVWEEHTQNTISLDQFDEDLAPPATAPKLGFIRPALGGAALSIEELRWCFRELLRIDELDKLVSTSSELNKVEIMRSDVTELCDLSLTKREMIVSARKSIEEEREDLILEAQANQLTLLDDQNPRWERSVLVEEIQKLLDSLGYDVGIVDGLYGVQTQTAIKAFERDQGIEQQGRISQELLAKLRSASGQSGS